MHHYQDLITIFNNCFLAKYNTQLLRGANEPLYQPADNNLPHNTIYFAHGFYASALHECAHWFIAGRERRKLADFGYWYEPDGRSAEQQALFLRVEVKPQAIEWILSVAANFRFRVSLDNLNGEAVDDAAFKQGLYDQIKQYCEKGLPARAAIFRRALCQFYKTNPDLTLNQFDLDIVSAH
jgi:elongation factor P hydroxylase